MTTFTSPSGIGLRQRQRAGLGVEPGAAVARQAEHDDHQATIAAGQAVIRKNEAERISATDAVLEAVGEVVGVDLLRHPGARGLAAELVHLAGQLRRR